MTNPIKTLTKSDITKDTNYSIDILVNKDDIHKVVKTLGGCIYRAYQTTKDLTIISISNGAIFFTVDLIRAINNRKITLDTIKVSSYDGIESSSIVKLQHSLSVDIKDRNVLIVDDILDTGNTLSFLVNTLEKFNPSSIKTCVLFDKPSRRKVEFKADFVGFEIPDLFVIGYGLDYNNEFRELEDVRVLDDNAIQLIAKCKIIDYFDKICNDITSDVNRKSIEHLYTMCKDINVQDDRLIKWLKDALEYGQSFHIINDMGVLCGYKALVYVDRNNKKCSYVYARA